MGLGSVDGDRRDAVVHVHVDVTEGPTFPSGGLPGEEVGHGPAFCGQLGVGRCHAVRLLEADAVHQLERTLGPAKTNLGSAVNVFHRADVFLNNLCCNTKDNAKETLGYGCVLVLRVLRIVFNWPHSILCYKISKVLSTVVSRCVELLSKIICRM